MDAIRNAPMAEQIFPASLFDINPCYQEYVESVLLPNGLIKDRIQKLGSDILQDLEADTPVTILCILKGGFRFTVDLMSSMRDSRSAIKVDFLRLKSYENDASTGSVKLIGALPSPDLIKDHHVIISEDIIDTGRTIHELQKMLLPMNPKRISIACLLWKEFAQETRNQERLSKIPVTPNYVGFRIPDLFVIGYGLDYNEFYRDLEHICVINEKGKKAFST